MKKIIVLIYVGLVLTACSHASKENLVMADVAELSESQLSGVSMSQEPAPPMEKKAASFQNGANETPVKRKVIKTANVVFEVDNLDTANNKIKKVCQKYEAFEVSASMENNLYQSTQHMTIRVRPEKMDGLMAAILNTATYIESKNINARDVTEEFVDLSARLKNKKAVEAQYTALLKKAKTIKEILMVEENLRVLREEIEAAEGRLKYLSDQVSYSTIHLRFYQKEAVKAIGPGKSFLSKLGDGFSGGWQVLLSIIIGAAYLWPLWAFGLPVSIFIIKLLKRRRLKV